MLGVGAQFTSRKAEEFARKLLQKFNSRKVLQGGVAVTGTISGDGKSIVLDDGRTLSLRLEGNPLRGRVQGMLLDSRTVLVKNQVNRQFQVDGGRAIWTVVAAYPTASTSTPPPAFPYFNLLNAITLQNYRIPHTLCPGLFTVDPVVVGGGPLVGHDASNLGYNGYFYAVLSPNARTLVFVRVDYPDDAATLNISGELINQGATYVYHMRVRWAVIKNFSLNSVTGDVETNASTVITEGERNYDTSKSLPSAGSISTVNVSANFVFWGVLTENKLIEADPVVWFETDGTPRIEMFGDWWTAINCVEVRNSGGGNFHGPKTAYKDFGGLVYITDLITTGSLVEADYGGSSVVDPDPASPAPGDLGVVRADLDARSDRTGGRGIITKYHNNPRSLTSNTNPHLRFKYASTLGKSCTAWRDSAGSFGDELWWRNAPFLVNVQAEGYSLLATRENYYIGDESGMYPHSNTTTGWKDRYNTTGVTTYTGGYIKTTATGRFSELRPVAGSGGQIIDSIYNWRWDSDLSTMVQLDRVRAKETTTPFSVKGPGVAVALGTPKVLDFVVV